MCPEICLLCPSCIFVSKYFILLLYAVTLCCHSSLSKNHLDGQARGNEVKSWLFWVGFSRAHYSHLRGPRRGCQGVLQGPGTHPEWGWARGGTVGIPPCLIHAWLWLPCTFCRLFSSQRGVPLSGVCDTASPHHTSRLGVICCCWQRQVGSGCFSMLWHKWGSGSVSLQRKQGKLD